jgi:hypothetical protein
VVLPYGAVPRRWRTVARFTFGPRPGQLGFRFQHDLNPLLPTGVVVDRRGLWVCDPVKHRVAHFTLNGQYLGQVTGIREVAGDIAEEPDGRLVVVDDEPTATLRVISPAGRLSEPIRVPTGGTNIDSLVPTDAAVGIASDGFFGLTPAWHIDPTSDGVHSSAGVFHGYFGTVDPTSVAVEPLWADQLDFSHGQPAGGAISQPVAFWIDGARVHGWFSGAGDAPGSTVGGQFYVQFDQHGHIAVAEKVAADLLNNVARPLIIGPDHRTYQWFVSTNDAELRQRPTS